MSGKQRHVQLNVWPTFLSFELQSVLSPLSIIFDENIIYVTVFLLSCSRTSLPLFLTDCVKVLSLRSLHAPFDSRVGLNVFCLCSNLEFYFFNILTNKLTNKVLVVTYIQITCSLICILISVAFTAVMFPLVALYNTAFLDTRISEEDTQ